MTFSERLRGALHTFGPAFLVSVAYLDPGNWATAIEGGSKFGYQLIWVVVASNLIAILLQVLAARLGIVSGKHLAEVCREIYPPSVCILLWCLSEISIIALDLTMVIGTAVGINLLFGIPLLPCIVLTNLDFVVILITVPKIGKVRLFELFTVCVTGLVLACFCVEVALSAPSPYLVLRGFVPTLDRGSIYTAVSLLGANVMPHNFYLHSALVKGRHKGNASIQALCRLNLIDVALALGVALAINLAVLVVSASTFHSAGVLVETLQAAHDLMEQLLSSQIAPAVFGLALLLTSQLSTFTSTISGQVVLQGFLNIELSPWLHRLLTRSLAMLPAAVLQMLYGDSGTYRMLVIAQVVLAIQLPFTLVPLIRATSDRRLMGPFASNAVVQLSAWLSTLLIFLANLMLFAAILLPPEPIGLRDVSSEMVRWPGIPGKTLMLTGIVFLATVGSIALLIWMLLTPMSDMEPTSSLVVTVQNLEASDKKDTLFLEEIILKEEPVRCRLVSESDTAKLGRGSRKALALMLDGFWSQYYDHHGAALSTGGASQGQSSLEQTLLSIHSLDPASAVLPLEQDSPWDAVHQEILSVLHIAMTGVSPAQLEYPWRCPQCQIEITDPMSTMVETAQGGCTEKSLFLFGIWSLKQLLELSCVEPRPELWGKYGSVLNRLQWLLPHIPCSINDREISCNDLELFLERLHRHLTEKKGAKGTAPAATAFPKGKEILISVLKRYRRALKGHSSGNQTFTGSALVGILHFLLSLYHGGDD